MVVDLVVGELGRGVVQLHQLVEAGLVLLQADREYARVLSRQLGIHLLGDVPVFGVGVELDELAQREHRHRAIGEVRKPARAEREVDHDFLMRVCRIRRHLADVNLAIGSVAAGDHSEGLGLQAAALEVVGDEGECLRRILQGTELAVAWNRAGVAAGGLVVVLEPVEVLGPGGLVDLLEQEFLTQVCLADLPPGVIP